MKDDSRLWLGLHLYLYFRIYVHINIPMMLLDGSPKL